MVQFLAVAGYLFSSGQASYGAHLASYRMVTIFLSLWVKLLGHEDDQSLSSSAKIMHMCTYVHYSILPSCHGD